MIATIVGWFKALLSWFGRIFEWIAGVFKDFMEFFLDLPSVIIDGILDGVIYVLSGIPVPDFVQSASLQQVFNALGPDILYLVDFFGIHYGLAIVGTGVAFRLTRKALTLGQW